MSHLSGVCSNCGKPKEEHFGLGIIEHEWCEDRQYDGATFYDSGQKDKFWSNYPFSTRQVIRIKN